MDTLFRYKKVKKNKICTIKIIQEALFGLTVSIKLDIWINSNLNFGFSWYVLSWKFKEFIW